MDEERRGTTKAVTARLAAAEYSALVKAAERAEMTVPELVGVFITFCLDKLASGDAEVQRAVKGSRDAGVR